MWFSCPFTRRICFRLHLHANTFLRQRHNSGDHVECVTIDYDPKKVAYNRLLDLFWNNHEYGLTKRVKRQYSSLILYHTEEQKRLAIDSMAEERVKRAPEVIITEIAAASTFYPAEE